LAIRMATTAAASKAKLPTSSARPNPAVSASTPSASPR
jgi:hypothetical protein